MLNKEEDEEIIEEEWKSSLANYREYKPGHIKPNSFSKMQYSTLQSDSHEPLNRIQAVSQISPKIHFMEQRMVIQEIQRKTSDEEEPLPPTARLLEKESLPSCSVEDIVKAVFENDIEKTRELVDQCSLEILDSYDTQGNTPLMLCLKLCRNHDNSYLDVLEIFLAKGVSVYLKDKWSWSPLDEVVSQLNVRATVLIFEEMVQRKTIRILKMKKKIDELLTQIPDFKFSLKWEFESSMIPFVRKLAPSDTFIFRKKNNILRVDYSIAGYKRLSVKRRNLSMIYNGLSNQQKKKF